jgi:hypothetical protein
MVHDVPEDEDPAFGDWLDEGDCCWDRLYAEPEDSPIKLVVKCYRGRIVVPLADMRQITQAETIEEFCEGIGIGAIREIFVAQADAPVGRVGRGA